MTSETTRSLRRHGWNVLFLLGVGLVVRLLYLAVLPRSAVSIDMRGWELVFQTLDAGANPYNATNKLNWPPLWMQIVYVLGRASAFTGWSLVVWVRLFLMFIEGVLIVVLYGMLRDLDIPSHRARNLLLAGISLNPACVFQVCQHLNFDVLVALWLALSLFALVRFICVRDDSWWLLSALFLGMGILTKTVPLAMVPILAVAIRDVRNLNRLIGLFLLFVPAALGLSVVYVLGPQQVHDHVISYRSWCANFGVTGYLNAVFGEEAWRLYTRLYARFYPLVLIAMAGWIASRRVVPVRFVVLGANALMLVLPVFGTGWGGQYIYWFVPLFVVWFSIATRPERYCIGWFYLVVQLTYLVDYALNGVHGAFLMPWVPSNHWLATISRALDSVQAMTWMRTPMYLMFAALFLHAVQGMLSSCGRPPDGARAKEAAGSRFGDSP